MNVFESGIHRASLNGRLPAYGTYQPRFDVTHLFSGSIMHSMYGVVITVL